MIKLSSTLIFLVLTLSTIPLPRIDGSHISIDDLHISKVSHEPPDHNRDSGGSKITNINNPET